MQGCGPEGESIWAVRARRADGGRRVRGALYARVSTDDKGQDPEVQLQPMRELAAARGWVWTEYVDRASASDIRGRREWRRLLDDAHQGGIDVVLVWKLDRFARSALDALQWLQQLDSAGVGLKILTQEIDTTTSAGRLVFTILRRSPRWSGSG